jgi:mono/diheme cytochrome c family protein
LPGDPESGRRLFAAKRCAECHGLGAPGKGGPDLADRRLRGSPIDTAAAMWNKAPAMIAAMKSASISLPLLRPGEMADILAYLAAVRYTAGAGDARRGLAIAGAKGCLGCHAAADLGRSREVETPGGALAALWNHSFLGEPRAGVARAAWAPMTGDEMADLMAFLQSSRRAR